MNYSTYRFTLDIHKARSQVSIPVMYQDTWVRLYVNLTDGGKPYQIAEGCTAVLYGKKADGTALVNDCEVIDNNTRIVYTFNPQTASALGPVECEIRLYSNGLHLTTPSFTILVEERVIEDDDIIESEADPSAIDRIFESESERVEAEAERQAAETAREEKMEELESRVAECEDKVGEGGSSAENSQRFERLEQDVAEHGAAISDINEALGKKADADTMNAALANKADASTMATELAKKADAATMDTALNKKADADTMDTALANKVPKSSGVNHVYATDSKGNHLLMTWAQSVSKSTLVRRDNTGAIFANAATLDGQVVNLGQMNAALADKADAATMATELAALESKIGTGSGGSTYDDTEIKASIAEFDSKVATALSDSKSYTDNRFNEILGEGGTDKLDTLAEIAEALGEDENFSATILGRLSSTDADIATLMAWMNESKYVPLKFTTLPYVSSGSLYAVGQSVSSVTVKWAFNKTPETLTVNGVSETNTAITSKTFSLSTPITYQNTSNHRWTISGSVTKPNGSKDTVSLTTSAISFGSYVISGYTGTKTYSASVHAPTSKQTSDTIKTSRPTSFTGTGKGYIYLFFPVSFGKPTGYKYNGLAYKFDEITQVTFTNKHGIVGQSYYYCRTTETLTSESRTLTIEY